MSKTLVSLKDAQDVGSFGGKASSLAHMLQAGLLVPGGFVISTEAYKQFSPSVPKTLKTELLKAFDSLGVERVAVRSSAVAEDSSNASWAGQLETVLNVTRDGLIEAVEHCWKSMQSERAQSYALEQGVTKEQQAVAVVVQAMVSSEISGVMFTANPITNDRNQTVIEAIHGLGELLVQGTVTPESYVLNSKTGEVISQGDHKQAKMLVYKNGKNTEIEAKSGKVLGPVHLHRLLEQGQRIQNYYAKPQDIEFAFENGKLYIVQSRPITTL